MNRTEFNNSILELISEVHKATYEIRVALKPSDVTQIQYNILEYLYQNEGKSLGEISECLYLSLPNTSREVRKLIEKDYLVKKNSENDKRITYIHYSNIGRELMDTTFGKINESLNDRYSDLTAEEVDDTGKMIKRVTNTLFK